METILDYPTLTPSGKGILIENKSLMEFSKEEIWALLRKYHWIAFKKQTLELEELTDFLSQFGRTVCNDRREGAVLKIDGTKNEEVFLGSGFLPLHKDGLLMGNNVGIVSIFCLEYSGVKDGRTFIVDIENAVHDIPTDIQDLLRERGMEVKPKDQYYIKAADKWYHMSGFAKFEGKEYLNVGFPYKKGDKQSWEARIPGVDEDRFYEIFDILDSVVMNPKFCYHHNWDKGDILLFDNRKTLHGREAFQGRRALANIQVVLD